MRSNASTAVYFDIIPVSGLLFSGHNGKVEIDMMDPPDGHWKASLKHRIRISRSPIRVHLGMVSRYVVIMLANMYSSCCRLKAILFARVYLISMTVVVMIFHRPRAFSTIGRSEAVTWQFLFDVLPIMRFLAYGDLTILQCLHEYLLVIGHSPLISRSNAC